MRAVIRLSTLQYGAIKVKSMRSKHRQANIVKKKERSLLLSRGEERFDAVKLQFRQGEDFMNCYGNARARVY